MGMFATRSLDVQPRTRRSRSTALAFWIALAVARVAAPQTAAVSARPDMVTLSTPSGDVLYVLDPSSGHVSFAPVPRDLPASISINTMTGLVLPRSVRCAAIATRWNHLVFLDVGGSAPAVRELDPVSGAVSPISPGARLGQPTAIAASAGGDIVVADQQGHATIWLRDDAPPRTVPWATLARPMHLEFDNRDVYAYDADSRRLVLLPASPREAGGRAAERPLEARLANLRGVSVHGGIHYLLGGDGLFAEVPGAAPQRVPCAECPETPDLIYATRLRLFVHDAAHGRIAVVSRPVPVGVSIETSAADAQRGLAAFYAYLSERGILPVRQYIAPHAYDRIVDALSDERVIIPLANGTAAQPVQPEAYSPILCRHNQALCRGNSFPWNERLAAGQPVTVPDFAVRPFLRTETVDLKGISVQDRLRQQAVSTVDANAMRVEYVQSLNRGSFEDALARQGLVVASPARDDLQPGTIFTAQGGVESVRGGLSSLCGLQAPIVEKITPISIPDRVTDVAIKDYIPLTLNADGSPKDLGVKDGDEYTMSFRRTKLEQLDTAALTAPPLADRLAACVQRVARTGAGGRDPLLVVEALRVDHALYELQQRDVTINSRFYIAYRAVPLSLLATGSFADAAANAVTPALLKPGGPQDILRRTVGTVQLPTTAWSLDALVPAEDLGNPDSALAAIEKAYGGHILVLSKEIIPVKAASAAARALSGEPLQLEPQTLARMKTERDELLKAINYRDIDRERMAPVRIAIGEERVDLNHPALVDTDGGAPRSVFWEQAQHNQAFVRHTVATGPVPGGPRKRDFAKSTDHGVHVAGLLAARTSAALPGLLPRAELFFINTTNLSRNDLHESIQHAMDAQVKIFNFSLTFQEVSQGVVEAVRNDFKNEFGGLLFIVAAGDDALNLSDHQIPPLSWMHDVRTHMIGVGATTADGTQYLRQYKDGPRDVPVSNVGQEYVQLAAPGRDVFSLGSDNSYTEATGTSQAVPQVTAAAAMLDAFTASQIKARLIYTADWLDTPGYVWGGRLNVQRAVWNPNKSLFVDKSDIEGPPIAAEFEPTIQVSVTGGEIVEPDGNPGSKTPPTILFGNVLRLTTQQNGLYRVHYIDEDGNRLRIIDSAELHAFMTFRSKPAIWNSNPTVRDFVDIDATEEGLDLSEFIFDYVARVPASCKRTTGACVPITF